MQHDSIYWNSGVCTPKPREFSRCWGWAGDPRGCKNPKSRAGVWGRGILSPAPSPLWLLGLGWAFPGPGCDRSPLFILPLLPTEGSRIRRNATFQCNEWEQGSSGASGNGFGRVFFFLTFPNFPFFFPPLWPQTLKVSSRGVSGFLRGTLVLPGFFFMSS